MIHNDICAFRCTRAHVYREDGRLYVDYWGVDEGNPKVEIHIPKMLVDIKSMQFNVNKIKNPYIGSIITSGKIMASSDKKVLFEILVKDERKNKKAR